MHAGDTTNNICMGNYFPGTVQQLINLHVVHPDWTRFAAKYRTPVRSR